MVTREALFPAIAIFPDDVIKKKLYYYYVWVGIFSVWLIAIDIYPGVVKKCHFWISSQFTEFGEFSKNN